MTAASTSEGLAFVEEHEIVGDKSEYTYLEGTEFRRTMREGVLTGDFPNWKGYWKRQGGGWVHARKAYVRACQEAERLGASFVSGDEAGRVMELLYDDTGGDVIGARTADGKEHFADRTILTAGAYADKLLDFEDQLRPTAWTLCHIKISDEELELYKDLPVMFNVERGMLCSVLRGKMLLIGDQDSSWNLTKTSTSSRSATSILGTRISPTRHHSSMKERQLHHRRLYTIRYCRQLTQPLHIQPTPNEALPSLPTRSPSPPPPASVPSSKRRCQISLTALSLSLGSAGAPIRPIESS